MSHGKDQCSPQVACSLAPDDAALQEALTGEVAPGNEEFQSAIKRAVPLEWVFKVSARALGSIGSVA